MTLYTVGAVANITIVLICTWAALTHKVKTSSLEILALGLVCLAATVGAVECLESRRCINISQVLMSSGLALYGLLSIVRVELVNRSQLGAKNETAT